MNRLFLSSIKAVINQYPAVIPQLKGRARWVAFARDGEYKSAEYFLATIQRLVKDVYFGNMGGEFIDIMASLIQGQINQAYLKAWQEEGDGTAFPDYLASAAEADILHQYDYVDQYYRDIVDARVDQTPIDPLLSRASLWANRYNESYDNAVHLITLENGGKEEWVLGATEAHCPTCAGLNGIVAYASEWDELGVRPQNGPNPLLVCGGWNCDCERRPTDKRRSPNARASIENVIVAGNL